MHLRHLGTEGLYEFHSEPEKLFSWMGSLSPSDLPKPIKGADNRRYTES